jgi:hypothetical protein
MPPIINILLYSFLPGLCGGVVSFVFALSKNHYKNNKYVIKLLTEILGASLTASFVTLSISNPIFQATLSFLIGVGWSRLIQLIRNKVTKIVEAILGVTFDGGKE